MMVKKNIIDTHIHIWDLEKARYEWLDNDTSVLNRSYHLEELLPEMSNTPVASGILVQAANNLEDTTLMLDTAGRHREIIAIVGWLPLMEPHKVQMLLEKQFDKEPYFKGVRHLIHNESDPRWLLQPQVTESLEMLASYHIPYDIVGINNEHLKTAIQVSEKIPSLRMVLDHLNQPPIKAGQRFGTWGELMKEIAANGNVYAKISGLGTASGNPVGWTADDIAPYVGYALEVFGTDRCFLGGDWPVSTLAGSYGTHWEKYTGIINTLLNDEDAEKVYYMNASLFYNL
ncbi:amidohydrolase family protein [Agriterribacter sp.]|uniref:amidohydrolase family protein n=1 Tax=Agriterribacter sp. TaxID=2821509 RepID=UPI002C89BBE0|nr:amidohydrolase family protein [Agriterribacter sp.]HRP57322.1 amidohydrolase family protein [Agriterribacter sp.]